MKKKSRDKKGGEGERKKINIDTIQGENTEVGGGGGGEEGGGREKARMNKKKGSEDEVGGNKKEKIVKLAERGEKKWKDWTAVF